MATEAELLEQIIGTTPGHEGLAIWLGWEVVHFRPARTKYGWRTPVQGSLGKGWPDLILARPPRLIAAELKGPKGRLEPEQRAVLDVLEACGLEVHVWRPDDWESILAALR